MAVQIEVQPWPAPTLAEQAACPSTVANLRRSTDAKSGPNPNRLGSDGGKVVLRIAMATQAHLAVWKSVAARRWLLITAEVIVAVNAVGGAIWGLRGAKDVPREWLEGTPFDSYVVPSLILLIAIGGGMGAAATALLINHRFALELSIAAGLILIGWIVVQVLLIAPNGGVSWLQPAMLGAGGLVVALGWRLRDARPQRAEKEGDSRVDSR